MIKYTKSCSDFEVNKQRIWFTVIFIINSDIVLLFLLLQQENGMFLKKNCWFKYTIYITYRYLLHYCMHTLFDLIFSDFEIQ